MFTCWVNLLPYRTTTPHGRGWGIEMNEFVRVGMHKGRVLITNGAYYAAFFSAKRYRTRQALENAIDDGSIDSGIMPPDGEFAG